MNEALPVNAPISDWAPWPSFSEEEVAAVTQVLRSGQVNYWTGSEARSFEREYAESVGIPHAIALANGTVSLELALHVLGIGPGDEVITSPRTFIASASCIIARGATPVFADVDANSQNISAETIEPVLTARSKAIIPVHLAGWPCEMDGIMALARSRHLKVIEDCAQANGATYRGQPVGAIGDIGSFSFCQDKIISTGGEGGLMTTRDEQLWRDAWAYKDHGKSYQAVYDQKHAPGFRWLHHTFGTNWRMTEMQAAIGRVQLQRLPEWMQKRSAHAEFLTSGLAGLSALRIPEVPPHIRHAWYKFYAFIRPEALRAGWSRDRIMVEIADRGIPAFSGSCPEIYLERAFVDRGIGPPGRLPVARQLGEASMMFLVHPTLKDSHLEAAVDVIQQVVSRATR